MKRNTFEKVKEEREKIGRNRANFKFSDEVNEALKKTVPIRVRLKIFYPVPPLVRGKQNTIDIRQSSRVLTINLQRVFGHKFKDGLILLALLFFRGFKWRREAPVGYKGRNFDCWYIFPTESPEAPIDDFVAAILGIKTQRPAYGGPQYIRRTPLEIITRWRSEEALGKESGERNPPFSSSTLSFMEQKNGNIEITYGIEFADVESLINYLCTVVESGELRDPTEGYSDATKIRAMKDALAKVG